MPCLTSDVWSEPFRLGEDWVQTVTCFGDGGEPFNLIGFSLEARLTDWFRPNAAPALVASMANGLVEIGDRNADGSVPLIIRVPAAQVAQALRSHDYRLDLAQTRDGLTEVESVGKRIFRS